MNHPGHYVAVFGGAVAGSEAAERLASRGIHTIVFEQYNLPYGKIESGLPKWHVKLRNSQESKIDQKLKHPLVDYVPGVRLGTDLSIEELIKDWGVSAVLLATGAWKDRPMPIKDIDNYVNKGLYYQNPFVSWFNSNHDLKSTGGKYIIPDDVIVVGGGLASFDVVKIIMLETARKALLKFGHHLDILVLEKMGIAEALQQVGLQFKDLGIKACTLFYRRAITDMPLTSLPDLPTARDIETAHRVRRKIFDNIRSKYLFNMAECHMPVDTIVENDRLKGLVFQKTKIVDGVMQAIDGAVVRKRSPLVISAIGSLPEPIPGIDMKGGVYQVLDQESGKLKGFDNVFALGNAVTGRGNIKESQMHGRQVSEKVMDEFLAWQPEDYEEIFTRQIDETDKKIDRIGDQLADQKLLDKNKMAFIIGKVKELQARVGYNGDYDAWIKKNLPPRIEDMM